MFAEKLSLEVEANKLGWKIVRPPRVRGSSGVEHNFSFVATSGRINYAFDVYDQVSEVEVIKTYARKYDTSAIVNLVSIKGESTPAGRRLAKEYGMTILKPDEIAPFFTSALVQTSPEQAESKRALLSV